MNTATHLLASLTIVWLGGIPVDPAYASDPVRPVANSTLPLIPVEVMDAKGQKVAGADVIFIMGFASSSPSPNWAIQRAVTDGEGKASARVVLGPADQPPPGGTVWAYKPGFGLVRQNIMLRSSISRGEPPPITNMILETPVPQTITVVDAEDRPVEGLRLSPRSYMSNPGYPYALPDALVDALSATTDINGQVTFRCFSKTFQTSALLVAGPSMGTHALPLPLGGRDATLKLGQTGRLVGIVRSDSGQPLGGVSVEIWLRGSGVRPRTTMDETLTQAERIDLEARSLRTGPQGAFQTPSVLLSKSAYCVVIRHPGFAPYFSEWVTLEGSRAVVPPIRLRALKTLTGIVQDGRGKAVSGVRVFVPGGQPSALSDKSGRFTLGNVIPERTFVLVQHPEFRFHGWSIDAASHADELKLTLIRNSEPLDRPMAPLQEPISQEDARALASRLFEPYLQDVLDNGVDSERRLMIQYLAEMDLERAVGLVNQDVIKDRRTLEMARLAVASVQATTNSAAAEALIEPTVDPVRRIAAFRRIAAALPAAQDARKRELLDKANLLLAKVPTPVTTNAIAAGLARDWLALGDLERARTLIREHLPISDKLSDRPGYATFLNVLARVDPEAALERIRKVPEDDPRLYLGLAIAEIAIEQPAVAEQLFQAKGAQDYLSIANALQLCRQFGRTEPERGRRVAESRLSRGDRTAAWASVSAGRAERKDHAGALEAIDRAIMAIDEVLEKGPRLEDTIAFRGFEIREANPAVLILPLVEQAAPERLEEVFWRAVALHARVEPIREHVLRGFVIGSECTLLARYDRQVASVLFEPVDRYLQSLVAIKPAIAALDQTLLVAKACIDPRGAVELLETFPPAAERGHNSPANAARIEIARALAAPPLERWRIRWKRAAPEIPFVD